MSFMISNRVIHDQIVETIELIDKNTVKEYEI